MRPFSFRALQLVSTYGVAALTIMSSTEKSDVVIAFLVKNVFSFPNAASAFTVLESVFLTRTIITFVVSVLF